MGRNYYQRTSWLNNFVIIKKFVQNILIINVSNDKNDGTTKKLLRESSFPSFFPKMEATFHPYLIN
jgi:hypothetical protein